jgi:hypothetical protein
MTGNCQSKCWAENGQRPKSKTPHTAGILADGTRKTKQMTENAENSKRAAPGRPFQPGQSGNPGGRPKGIAAIARQHTDKAMEVLTSAMEDTDARVRVAAAKEILDRGYGKAPVFTADLTGKLDDLDDDALDAALSAIGDAIRASGPHGDREGPQTAH